MEPLTLPTFTIYVLKLADGKYYVGAAKDINARYEQHKTGKGCKWTTAYPPVCILETIPNKTKIDEDAKLKEVMFRFGIDNVRGGSYCSIMLSPIAISVLSREMYTIRDLCWRCGKSGHFISECSLPGCGRCGRKHTTETCHSTEDISGNPLSAVVCSRCGRNHHTDNCYFHHHLNGTALPPAICKKCGSKTHITTSCFTVPSQKASLDPQKAPPGLQKVSLGPPPGFGPAAVTVAAMATPVATVTEPETNPVTTATPPPSSPDLCQTGDSDSDSDTEISPTAPPLRYGKREECILF